MFRSPTARASAALLLAGLAGCFERPAPVAPTEAAAPPPSPAPGAAAPAAAAPTAHLGPRVDVADVTGGDATSAREALLPTAEPMKHCVAGSGGAIRIRIRSDERSTSMKIEEGSSIDGAVRRCVLEALSTVDLDDIASRGSPSSRASGFSSIVTVAW